MSTAVWAILIILSVYLVYSTYRRYQSMKNYDPANESEKLIQLTDANFEKEISNGVVLVDFWAAWCGPCKMIAPVVSELAEQFEGKAKIAKLNVDEQKQTALKYGVRSIPTLIIFKNGEPVDRLVGLKSKSNLAKAIEKHLA